MAVNDDTASPATGSSTTGSSATGLSTVGMVSRRTGLSVHTVRFWSDSGLVPPSGWSAGGYRLYDAAAVARFDLVRTLRDLGVGLEDVKEILAGRATPAEVAGLHARALDAEIRTLRLRRAVLRTIAGRGGTTEEMMLMNKPARLSAAERQQVIDEFVAGAGEDAMIVAEWMRELPAELPDDPAPEQVDAWVELAELVACEDFRRRLRAIVLGGARDPRFGEGFDLRRRVLEHAGRALAEGVAPGSAEGRRLLGLVTGPGPGAGQLAGLRERLELLADPGVERYWLLLALLNGRIPSPTVIPEFHWVIAALRAHG